MADYHFTYKDVEGTSTQWDDIQRKLGNLPGKPPAFKPPDFTPAEDEDSKPKDKSWIDSKTHDELEDLEDDFDDDRFLEDYRRKRLEEMKEAAKVVKFGSIMPIAGSDFIREVSQAPADVWVVVILYKEGFAACELLMTCLEELSRRYPATKFVKIVSTDCIPNYPDCNLPTLLVYNNSAVKANYVGLQSFGRRCTPEGVALVLCHSDPVLNDGVTDHDSSRKSVLDGESKRLIEKFVTERENADDGYTSPDSNKGMKRKIPGNHLYHQLATSLSALRYAGRWTLMLVLVAGVASIIPELAFLKSSQNCGVEGFIRIPMELPGMKVCLPAHIMKESPFDVLIPALFASLAVGFSAFVLTNAGLF